MPTCPLALSAIVPTIRNQVPFWAMMVAGIRASDPREEMKRAAKRVAFFEIYHLQPLGFDLDAAALLGPLLDDGHQFDPVRDTRGTC